ncbi:hypothetical protein PVAND_001137 [Polypedilum vanderplanki]|uniref:Uncharacterized protein n=1 Tax=Polypedilum vanderplanki TaxID=319348 RepID=A0A9J6BM15_POLVA|nr:hypothetical protein PVAND_001137 [Polypedilum vanderplanki]
MKFLLALSTFLMLTVLVTSYPFAYSPYSAFTGDFGGPSAFGGAFPSASLISDNRGNRGNQGPVVFPMPPTDGPMESSGVVIGASGFGFVPPNGGSSANFAYGRRRYF